jgi:hypothetical protein
MNNKIRRKEEVETIYTVIIQGHKDTQAEEFQTIESNTGSDISVLDPLKEEGIRNL